MNKQKLQIVLLAMAAFTFTQCKKNDTTTPAVAAKTVYVGGYETDGTNAVAKIWKDGTASSVTTTGNAGIQAIYVSGTDVYAGGYETNGSNITVAKIWKNGVATALTDGTNDAIIASIYIAGTDIYAAGYEKNASNKEVGKIWK